MYKQFIFMKVAKISEIRDKDSLSYFVSSFFIETFGV